MERITHEPIYHITWPIHHCSIAVWRSIYITRHGALHWQALGVGRCREYQQIGRAIRSFSRQRIVVQNRVPLGDNLLR
jgi:hypothetical protein